MENGHNETVWVVTEFQDGGKITTTVYDNESDAENYFNEMKDRYGDPGRVRIDRSMLIRRVTDITTDEAPWGALRIDIRSEFVEGLMEDMVPLDQIKPGAAEKFVCEKIDLVRKKTLEQLDEIVRNETIRELELSQQDWSGVHDMEH